MKTLSIVWGNQQSSPIKKVHYRAAFKDYAAQFGSIFVTEQMHGIAGCVVDQARAQSWAIAAPQGDYLITQEPNLWLGVLTADCVPMIFFDPGHEVVAIAHAGWRGTVGGIAQIVLDQLATKFQTNLQELQVFFGPAARSCCYEVDQKFMAPLEQDVIARQCLTVRHDRSFFDVLQYNVLCLQSSGVLASNVSVQASMCTICQPGYCSYRKYGDQTGLQLSMVALR